MSLVSRLALQTIFNHEADFHYQAYLESVWEQNPPLFQCMVSVLCTLDIVISSSCSVIRSRIRDLARSIKRFILLAHIQVQSVTDMTRSNSHLMADRNRIRYSYRRCYTPDSPGQLAISDIKLFHTRPRSTPYSLRGK